MLDPNTRDTTSDHITELVEVYEESGDEVDGGVHLLGWMAIDEHGHLEITQTGPPEEGFLQRLVERLNGKPRITLISDEAAETAFATRVVTVTRGEPGFVAALRVYIRTYYGLRLV